ncbi:hypothetical protein CR205_18460 [Alteribacter lacisalsi]|uniref:Uncharacterized protein n=1 Tax=Alteribacter lacisalsi TaxID=2045244 RepID=A0A2W0H147_9BACI|nr:hypothetical protein CR205_18460 [Alteribacter lacisalsi]
MHTFALEVCKCKARITAGFYQEDETAVFSAAADTAVLAFRFSRVLRGGLSSWRPLERLKDTTNVRFFVSLSSFTHDTNAAKEVAYDPVWFGREG